MHNAVNRYQALSNLAAPEPLRDTARGVGRLSHGIGRLRRWLAQARDSRRARFQSEPLDDHTLNDIGLPRIEMLYRGPK